MKGECRGPVSRSIAVSILEGLIGLPPTTTITNIGTVKPLPSASRIQVALRIQVSGIEHTAHALAHIPTPKSMS